MLAALGERLVSGYCVEKLIFQGAKNNLSLLGKLYLKDAGGSLILYDRSLWTL